MCSIRRIYNNKVIVRFRLAITNDFGARALKKIMNTRFLLGSGS